jgi:hypothetical protein
MGQREAHLPQFYTSKADTLFYGEDPGNKGRGIPGEEILYEKNS